MSQDTIIRTFNFLGVTVNAEVPATSAAWDAIRGEGDCVSTAVDQYGFHSFANPVRTAIKKALEAAGHKAEEGESDKAFIARLTKEGVDLNAIAGEAANAVSFIKCLSTGSGRAKIAQQYIDQAVALQAKWSSGASTPERFLTNVRLRVPGAILNDADDVNEVAQLVRAWATAQTADELS